MLRRLLALLLVAAVLGFLAFAVTLPRPAGGQPTDAVIVLTGGEGRIPRALDVLRRGWAKRLLVSGVDSQVTAGEFAARYQVSAATMACCITLGYESVDTRSNAREAANWIAAHHARSLRLVTSDWHMRRAAWELSRTIPADVAVVEDAVPTHPSLNMLMVEYSKYLARRLLRLAHRG